MQSVPVLLRGEEYLYRYFDDAAITAQFLPSGDDVLVSGLEVEPLVLPLRPLAEVLDALAAPSADREALVARSHALRRAMRNALDHAVRERLKRDPRAPEADHAPSPGGFGLRE
ncbi:hypothetical protein [Saccharothrix sp. ALI-22-I]|uniref:hypothetical protein n=1 Tax=Saccharothrix sp. ALI-22-I TaxID=1933778 RepID=UPI00117B91B9|nr:hypothetical protein [Saccharothrix sp. ALI-22-I]